MNISSTEILRKAKGKKENLGLKVNFGKLGIHEIIGQVGPYGILINKSKYDLWNTFYHLLYLGISRSFKKKGEDPMCP